jgi:hypothetical protein
MHHANYPHKYDKPPSHAFSLPREGALTDLLREAFLKPTSTRSIRNGGSTGTRPSFPTRESG